LDRYAGLWRQRTMKTSRHPERSEGAPAAAVSAETTIIPGNEREILHFVQNDRRGAWRGRWGVFGAAAGLVILLDQLTKWLVVRELGPDSARQSIDIAGGFITFDYARNDGVAFGLLQGGSWIVWVAVTLGLVIGGSFVAATVKDASSVMIVALGICAGGALGNLLDRILRGYVVDFVEIGRWPAFNVADAALTTGLVLIVLLQLMGRDRESQAA
jgi:signal peptidase II